MIISELPPGTAVLSIDCGLCEIDVNSASDALAQQLANPGTADWWEAANVTIGDWPGQGTPTK